jgi:hypothetical protein
VNEAPDPAEGIARRHLRAGWWALLVYLLLGVVLETLHGYKSSFYLDVGNETRRLMWRLAHAHGSLLALVNVVYGLTARSAPETASKLASGCLLSALFLLPLGFFGGGIVVHGGDPGLVVLVVPAAAIALAFGVATIARAVR